MNHCSSPENQALPHSGLVAWIAAIAAISFALPQLVRAERIPAPLVPANIQAPAGHRAFLEGHAVGTQNYICLTSGSGFAWTLFAPQATLFNDDFQQVITHFLSGNPLEGGTPRATWQHSRDTSSVWAAAIASSSDPHFVVPGAIPWLLLQVFGAQDGPTGGQRLTRTTFVQRVNTFGGIMPATGCTLATDLGKKVLVPYTADYFFYKDINDDDN